MTLQLILTNSWPLVGIGGVNREVVFGTACQLPDEPMDRDDK